LAIMQLTGAVWWVLAQTLAVPAWAGTNPANTPTKDFSSVFVRHVVQQLDQTEAQNRWNDAHGQSHLNQYLLYVDCARLYNSAEYSPADPLWVGSVSAEISAADLQALNQKVVTFDKKVNFEAGVDKKKIRFYVLYVDRYPIVVTRDENLTSYTKLKASKHKKQVDEAEKKAAADLQKSISTIIANTPGLQTSHARWVAHAIGTVVWGQNIRQSQSKSELVIGSRGFYHLESGGVDFGTGSAGENYLKRKIENPARISASPKTRLNDRVDGLIAWLTDYVITDVDAVIAGFKTGQARDFLSLRKTYLADADLRAGFLQIARKIEQDPLVYEGFEAVIKNGGEVSVGTQKFKLISVDLPPTAASLQTLYQAYQAFFDYKKTVLNVDNIVAELKKATDPAAAMALLGKLQDADYKRFSVEQRLYLISLLLSDWFFNQSKENLALKLIEFTPDQDTDAFYAGLGKPSVLLSDAKFKDTSRDPLVRRLCDRTNDSKLFVGRDNYKDLLRVLGNGLASNNTRRTDLNNTTDERRVFMWDESYFLRFDQAPVGTCDYQVSFTGSGKLSVVRTRLSGYKAEQRTATHKGGTYTYTTYVAQTTTEPAIALDPFDLVVVVNRSDLDMLAEQAPRGSLAVVPAIFLYYAANKQYNENWGRGAMLTLDVASFFIGFGELKVAVSLLTKSIAIANIIIGGTNAVITLSGADHNPEYKEIISLYHVVGAAIGGYQLGSAGLRTIKNGAERFVALIDKYAQLIQTERDFSRLVFLRNFLVNQLKIKGAALLANLDIKIDELAAAVKNTRTSGLLYSAIVPPGLMKASLYAVIYCIKAGKDATKRTYRAFKEVMRSDEYILAGKDPDALKAVDEFIDEKNFNAIAKTQEVADIAVADVYAALLSKLGKPEIIEKVVSRLPKDKLADLIKDLDKADLAQLLAQKSELVEIWALTRKSIGNTTNGGFTKFAIDIPTLESIAAMAKEGSSFRNKLGSGWEDVLERIIKTAKQSPCSTCGADGLVGRTQMGQYLDDVNYFVSNFTVGSGSKGEAFFNWMRGVTNPTANQLDELHQTIRDFAKRGIQESEVEGLGRQFPIGSKRYDLRRVGEKYTEYKNKDFVTYPITASSDDVDQFINGYLKNIKSMDDFEWKAGFDKLKSMWGSEANALTQMKKQWHSVFKSKADEIFNANPKLFNKIKLKDGTLVTNSELFSEFLEEATEANKLFNFIKVE